MAGSGNSCPDSILSKLGLRPVTKCSLAKFYVPAIGAAAYTALSINVVNPDLIVRVFPKRDITNLLVGSALIGTSSYIYTRAHLQNANTTLRVTYSATGALLLTFGSVLMWAILRSIVPPNPTVRTLAGIGTGIVLIKIGSNYLDFVDQQIAKK